MVVRQGERDPFIRNVFTLNTCTPIAGCEVLCFKREGELLQKWADFVRDVDPDVITGYNIQNFDFPYLINRAKHLNVTHFPYLGRIRDSRTILKDSVMQSKQMGRVRTRWSPWRDVSGSTSCRSCCVTTSCGRTR
uniref:DNA polymerase delta catalytic subunit n=1 Tax=Ixodes ricinus TaxID=34613 RepID=A0A0K8RBG7_IXORI